MRAAGGGLALGLSTAMILEGSSDPGMAELGHLIQVMALLTLLPILVAGFVVWHTFRIPAQQLPPAA